MGIKTYIGTHAKTFGKGRALSPEEFKSILECIKATENHTFDSERKIWYIPQTEFNIRMLTPPLSERESEFLSNELKKKEREVYEKIEKREMPKLKYELFDFQKLGASFLYVKERAILADETGLGKTPMSIAAAQKFKEDGKLKRALIVCPSTLKRQWGEDGIEKFTWETYTIIDGPKKKRAQQYEMAKNVTYTIANYEVLRGSRSQNSTALYIEDFRSIVENEYDLVIFDEVQRIKNWKARTTQFAQRIKSKYIFCLSATPLENKLEELFSIMRLIDEEILGNWWKFSERHILYDQFGGIEDYMDLEGVREKIAPYFLRRKKSDVLDLPDLLEENIYVNLGPEQRRVYREIQSKSIEGAIEKYVLLQQCTDSTGILRLSESYTMSQIQIKKDESTKFNELKKIIPGILESGNKLIVFSQSKRMIFELEKNLSQNYLLALCHGDQKGNERNVNIKMFRKNEECKILLSTEAGSVGLDLQIANYIINFDLPWNPARLSQRIGRMERIGQTKNMTVINLIASNTIDEGIKNVLERKKGLFKILLDDGKKELISKEEIIKEALKEAEKMKV